MWLILDDLRCSTCKAFVHPLLEACPSCGTTRVSRRLEAAAGPIGAAKLVEAPETQNIAHDITVRYTMKVNSFGSGALDATLPGAVGHLADALTYRVTGDGIPVTDNASLALRDGALLARVRGSGALLAEIPLPSVAGAVAGHGDITLHYAPRPGPATPETARPATFLRLTAANRRGLLAPRARDDHYRDLARLLGVLATAAAERRWLEIGLPAYLVELGLAVDGSTVPRSAAGAGLAADVTAPPAGGSPPGIEASLLELERLRAAGLLDESEYTEKRREILARL